ncbi:MAG: hypothetical protein MZW92_52650 [Comamonadaceae bacterium]|nr:hypothetical protein [Comamonadaceae bacterium]
MLDGDTDTADWLSRTPSPAAGLRHHRRGAWTNGGGALSITGQGDRSIPSKAFSDHRLPSADVFQDASARRERPLPAPTARPAAGGRRDGHHPPPEAAQRTLAMRRLRAGGGQ